MRPIAPLVLIALLLAGAGAVQAARGNDAEALALARREAAAATERSRALDNAARRATNDADGARSASEALAGRIEAAEADLTVAERRIVFIAAQQAVQRARLAQRQGPIIRLTAALQTMTRRPAALALVQPGSVRDAVHVRSLLAAALPEIRRRTAALRLEARRSADLRGRSELARQGLIDSRETLRQRRIALAAFEAAQRTRSQQLTGLALTQSDRALVYGEEAQALQSAIGTRQSDSAVAASLARLPGPLPRPALSGSVPAAAETLPYSLPVEGRVVTGVGEISDGGVHARGLTFETAAEARVVAPAGGRIVYAAPFRRYGNVVIIDHGRGWMTVLTDLGSIGVRAGQNVGRGTLIGGAAGAGAPHITLELRRNGRPVPVAQLIAG
jgi:septal ring factor EnvC (AmiA/AmiB activator)